MASDTLAPRTAVLVVRVLFDCGCPWTVRRRRTVTVQAELIGWLSELGMISGPMHIVAVETGYSAPVHNAFDEIVALHAVLMRRAIGIVQEVGRRTERPFLQLPMVLQLRPNVIADGPIVVLALDWVRKRLPLRVALNARVAGRHLIHVGRI